MTDEEFNKKLDGYFIAFCRRVFRWSPAYRETLKMAYAGKNASGKDTYKCANCPHVGVRRDHHIDHIEPVVLPTEGWTGDWNLYRQRCFVPSDKLQLLCKRCHKAKTKEETKIRAKFRAKRKKQEEK